jgi:hypothetical protein
MLLKSFGIKADMKFLGKRVARIARRRGALAGEDKTKLISEMAAEFL